MRSRPRSRRTPASETPQRETGTERRQGRELSSVTRPVWPDPKTRAEAEEVVRHELGMRIVELRARLYQVEEQLRQARLQAPDTDLLRARIHELTAGLAAVSWAETLEEAQAAARAVMREEP